MKAILFFFAVLIIFSCSSKHKIPEGILGPPKMQAILWDILRADEFVLNYTRHDSSTGIKDKSTRLYGEVFKIHNITRSQFEKSIDFYNLHPDLFKIVLDSLEKRKTDINAQLSRPPVIADSLRKKIKPSHIDSLRKKIKPSPVDSLRKKIKPSSVDSLRKKIKPSTVHH